MVKPNRSKKRQGVQGSSRVPGPIGIEFKELCREHSLFEHSHYHVDSQSTDWIQVTREGKSYSVFYRGKKVNAAKPSAPLLLDFRLRTDEASRGSTVSRLYLDIGLQELDKGRFKVYLEQATVDATIYIRPKSKFDPLAKFKPYYEEFQAMVGELGSRDAAFQAFSKKYVIEQGSEYSTLFDGKRAKTMEHEVHHLRFAQEEAENLVDNLMGLVQEEGLRKSGEMAWKRCRRTIESMGTGWNADPKGAFHRRIAEHDCLVMIAIYEAFGLSADEARAAGVIDPVGRLVAMLDYLTIELMEKLGEPLHTWGE